MCVPRIRWGTHIGIRWLFWWEFCFCKWYCFWSLFEWRSNIFLAIESIFCVKTPLLDFHAFKTNALNSKPWKWNENVWRCTISSGLNVYIASCFSIDHFLISLYSRLVFVIFHHLHSHLKTIYFLVTQWF